MILVVVIGMQKRFVMIERREVVVFSHEMWRSSADDNKYEDTHFFSIKT